MTKPIQCLQSLNCEDTNKYINKIADGFLTHKFPLDYVVVADFLQPLLDNKKFLIGSTNVLERVSENTANLCLKLDKQIDIPYVYEIVNSQLDLFKEAIGLVSRHRDLKQILWRDREVDCGAYFKEQIESAQRSLLSVCETIDVKAIYKLMYIHKMVCSFYKKGSKNLFLLEKIGEKLKGGIVY